MRRLIRPTSSRHGVGWRVVGVVVAMVMIASCSGGGGAAARTGTDIERLPSLEITTLDGGTVIDLADIEGPAVVNLWATWCPPCRTELPAFQDTFVERGDEINFVGLNVAEATDTAADFVAELGLTYDQYADPEGRVTDALGVIGMPTTVFVDADGVIVNSHTGELTVDELNAAIDRALGK